MRIRLKSGYLEKKDHEGRVNIHVVESGYNLDNYSQI